MESILDEGTPLATILEGEGIAEHTSQYVDSDRGSPSPPPQAFAPSTSQLLRPRLKGRFPIRLCLKIPRHGPVSRARIACSRALNYRIGSRENSRFIEHFRYVLIASQLLSEHVDHGSLQRLQSPRASQLEREEEAVDISGSAITVTGSIITASSAFALVWLLNWARDGKSWTLRKGRALILILCIALVSAAFVIYVRRQWLKYLRRQAVEAVSALTGNLKAFELASSSAISLIQEVELVSKGYRVSYPLPPISRLEDSRLDRRCVTLRRHLYRTYVALIPAFKDGLRVLQPLHNHEDYEKYLDAYDISREAVHHASLQKIPAQDEDSESLGHLRMLAYQCSTLRRAFLCSLLCLEAHGGTPDVATWRAANEVMLSVGRHAAESAQSVKNMLQGLEEFASPPTPKMTPKRGNERLRAQVRKISVLSQGIRTLQAKMALLREESEKVFEESDDQTDLAPNLMKQYDSIGTDLQTLMEDWQAGKAALASSIDRHERRISMASSGLRSPTISLGGATAVEDGSGSGGSPADALRALTGEGVSMFVGDRSSMISTASDDDGIVFEGLAIPRTRTLLSREERIAKMHEDRVRQAEQRDKRQSNTNMIRELQSVINLRQPPPKRFSDARIATM